ncbi:MAG: archaeal proteasome endopeptidase complex subunit alpha [Desulfurococcales archaeon]|nr:archaeal proteasome endopeptidase complex subunit alpha [Desulfurococcales archaeon]
MAFGPASAGYDRGITIFSPDGKLYQVEYAAVAVRQGWTIIGILGGDSAVLISEKRKHAPLIDLVDLEKIFIIDTHVGATFAGLGADGRILIDYARIIAVRHRFIYDEPIDMETLVRSIGDLKQLYTQQAGVRPFGVSLIFAGVDARGAHIYKTEPNGLYFRYFATAAGSGEQSVMEFLEKNYREKMSLEEAIMLGLKALRASVETGLSPERVEIGYVTLKDRIFRKLTLEEVGNFISKTGVDK